MSGHSKWSTIKRKKEAEDKARGKLFSKLSRMITVAVKLGNSSDPEANPRLRMAIEYARSFNMPKENIERAVKKGETKGENLEEVLYEGYGPERIGVLVEAATDNRNRTGQEIKNLFERYGGTLAGPGSVSYNFETKGLILVEAKKEEKERVGLELIDLGIDDFEETEEGIEVYCDPSRLTSLTKEIQNRNFKVGSFSIVKRPKIYKRVENKDKARKILELLEALEDHEDVNNVYSDVDIPDEFLKLDEVDVK